MNFSVGPSVGLGATYHLTEKIALQPFILFSSSTQQRKESSLNYSPPSTTVEATTTEQTWRLGANVAGLYFFEKIDNTIAPFGGVALGYTRSWTRGVYTRTSQETVSSSVTDAIVVGVSCGVYYSLSKRIALFAQIGLGYSMNIVNSGSQNYYMNTSQPSIDGNGSAITNSSLNLSTTGIGVIVYFN